jgi:hypothetical protein
LTLEIDPLADDLQEGLYVLSKCSVLLPARHAILIDKPTLIFSKNEKSIHPNIDA